MSAEEDPHDPSHAGHDSSHDPIELDVETHEESPTLRRLEVRVPEEQVRRAFDEAYRDLAKSARVKGFRPGKVPRKVLERLYGATLGEEIERALVHRTLPLALSRAGVEAVSSPSVDAQPPRPGEVFGYKALVEVRPPIELPKLAELEGRRPIVLVGDDEVEQRIEELRRRHAPIVEELEGTAAADGHLLNIDYVGRIDGEPFEGGSGRDVDLEIGSGRFLPGFEEQLVGATAGDDREVTVTFPDDYGAPQLAGRTAVFQVHVADVKRRDLPALDDDFAKDLGEFETIGALRDRIHEDLRASREQDAAAELRRSLLDALVERTEFEVPPGVTEAQLERRLRMAAQQLHGVVPDEALHGQLQRWSEEWKPAAEREVRERWLLDAVAESRELAVEDAAVAEQVEQMAAGQGVSAKTLRERVGTELLDASIRDDLRRQAALDFLAATAKVEEIADT